MKSRSIYCWGNTDDGQLGLGGIEETQIFAPRELQSLANREVKEVAVGVNHALFILSDGSLFSCGNNDFYQLGHNKPRKKPHCINDLDTVEIRQASCGFSYSAGLSNTGSVYTWGKNDKGQLGRTTTDNFSKPKLLKYFEGKHIITQLSCGYNHTLALAATSEVFSWGSNEYGQLGIDQNYTDNVDPRHVAGLIGLPIVMVACGGNHCFALTMSGALYSWGLNKNGQLGLGHQETKFHPTLCNQLKSQHVKYVCCGENHTAILTQDGGVFTFGAGTYGQLGHGITQSIYSPRKVFELMGSEVSMIACGRNHTLAYVTSPGKLYSFGLASNGQLGLTTRSNQISPVALKPLLPSTADGGISPTILSIFTNGDQCFVTAMFSENEIVISSDYRKIPPQISLFDEEIVNKVKSCATAKDELLRTVERIFSSLSCINGSFLTDHGEHYGCSETNHGVDVKKVKKAFIAIKECYSKNLTQIVEGTLERLLIQLSTLNLTELESMRIYVILPLTYIFKDPTIYYRTFLCPLAKLVHKMNKDFAKLIDCWWTTLGSKFLLGLVKSYKAIVKLILEEKKSSQPEALIVVLQRINFEIHSKNYDGSNDQHALYTCLETLKKLFYINESSKSVLDVSEFYISDLHTLTSLDNDYVFWFILQQKTHQQLPMNLDAKSSPVSYQGELKPYCLYPFVFDGKSKTYLLQVDAYFQMQDAVETVQRQNVMSMLLAGDIISPCLVLHVSRNNVVRDTIAQLSKFQQVDFKKPMKVIFLGEDAMDAGGVKKEFFMLLLKDILDPKYGMFELFEESRLIWFNATTFEASDMYQLIGVVCGLAIYNNNIIAMNLPLALFKKLLNKSANLDDLKELKPTVGRSMQVLLDYEGDDVAQVFNLNFELSREIYGTIETIQLVEGGSEKQVEKDNKLDFVNLYVDYIFNKSISEQFEAFSKGFHKVCGGKILELFQPKELQSMVVGNENYDWAELEKITQYKEYTKEDPTIILFWEVFHELPIQDKKKFLLFLTGCDRIPILGMSSVKMTIQAMGGSTDHLPVAHTCFNILDLPHYEDKEQLRQKLLAAIEHTQGFGLV